MISWSGDMTWHHVDKRMPNNGSWVFVLDDIGYLQVAYFHYQFDRKDQRTPRFLISCQSCHGRTYHQEASRSKYWCDFNDIIRPAEYHLKTPEISESEEKRDIVDVQHGVHPNIINHYDGLGGHDGYHCYMASLFSKREDLRMRKE